MMIGYARVSTLDQNPSLQTDALTAAGCDRIFTEYASGADRNRPELANALRYVQAGDTFVAYKLDRIARSLKHLIEIVQDLKQRRVAFKLIADHIDTSTAAGNLMFQIIGSFAEFERNIISERTLAGLAAARARGRIGGRPRKIAA